MDESTLTPRAVAPAHVVEIDVAPERADATAAAAAPCPSRRYATLTFLRGSIVALAIALASGMIGALTYVPALGRTLTAYGIDLTRLRPVHETFATAFIFLGGLAVVHRSFEDVAAPMQRGERLRVRAQVILWALAGAGILVSVAAGVFSGREYMGFHPLWSVPILLGWFCFAWNFLSHYGRGFTRRPVHITMWMVGVFFFMYTFIEQHAWLLPGVFDDPLTDLRVQWKATGTLVGSFNLFVYGTLYYVAIRMSGSDGYARSHLAYALFAVGLINSFTNFGHHTYHLPQNDAVKWISFTISMIEVILLARVVWDIAALVRAKTDAAQQPCAIAAFMTAAKWWTAFILATSIVLSVPPLNALVHGTHVIMGHGMGAAIGIDGMALFAAFCYLGSEFAIERGVNAGWLRSASARRRIIVFNVVVLALVSWLTVSGTIIGVTRYLQQPPPEWITSAGPIIFATLGMIAGGMLLDLVAQWLRLVFGGRTPHRTPETSAPC